MIEPKNIEVDGKPFILSKFPAIAGRKIISGYPLTGLPKIGDYDLNEKLMIQLMAHVGVPLEAGGHVMLSHEALINKHCYSWETLLKVEGYMMEYNCTFLANGRVSNFFQALVQKVQRWTTETLTVFLESSSRKTKRRSTN